MQSNKLHVQFALCLQLLLAYVPLSVIHLLPLQSLFDFLLAEVLQKILYVVTCHRVKFVRVDARSDQLNVLHLCFDLDCRT